MMLGPDIKRMIRDYLGDVQGDLRLAGDALITGRMSATELSLDGREVELGWIKDSIGWLHSSSTEILRYGDDVSELFPVGTKIRWTQGGGWKYAYVIGAAYASGVNTLTVTGGTDYTVANADIEDNYFSYAANPTGFPEVFNFTPVYDGFISDPTHIVVFRIDGHTLHYWAWATLNGTSDDDIFKMSAPATAASISGMYYVGSMGRYTNAGAASVRGEGRVLIRAGTSTILLQTSASTGRWTASGNKSAAFYISFPIG